MCLVACVGCASETRASASTCVADVKLDCAPQYSPATYSTIYEKILRPTCATGRGTCHTGDAAKGGLSFATADDGYELLLGTRGGRARVVAGDAACSILTSRVKAATSSARMPPGPTGLSDGEICTITRWIAEGAKR